MSIKNFSFLIVIVCFVSCVSSPPSRVSKYYPRTEKNTIPRNNEISTANLGDSLIESVVEYETYFLQINTPITFNYGWASPTIEPGIYKQTHTSGENILVFEAITYSNLGDIYLGVKEDSNADLYCLGNESYTFSPEYIAEAQNKFELYNDIYRESENFQQTFIYNGIIDNVIKLEYREFIDNKIRDAFSVPLEFDISESSLIGYKGVIIEVVEANNLGIKYKIIQPFER